MIGYRQGHITTMMGRFPSIVIITAEGYYNTLGLITGGFGAGLDHIIIFLRVIIIQIGPHYRWLWSWTRSYYNALEGYYNIGCC